MRCRQENAEYRSAYSLTTWVNRIERASSATSSATTPPRPLSFVESFVDRARAHYRAFGVSPAPARCSRIFRKSYGPEHAQAYPSETGVDSARSEYRGSGEISLHHRP